MCWDKRTSIITFVLGTAVNIFNIFYFQTTVITLLSIAWEWLLLMQLFEAIAWDSQPKAGEPCSPQNKLAANGALIANVTQPILIALLLIAFTPVPLQNKVIAMTAIFAYICWLVYAMNQTHPFTCLKKGEDCDHLALHWWDKFPGGSWIYMAIIPIVVLLLLRPMDLAWASLIYIAVIAVISSTFYGCGSGSVWCWFAAFAPLLTGLYWYYTRGPPIS
jgi:hypothetical protein